MKPKQNSRKPKRHYNGRLKIDMPFEDAVKLALQTKLPPPSKRKHL